jgi:hypothetical protein
LASSTTLWKAFLAPPPPSPFVFCSDHTVMLPFKRNKIDISVSIDASCHSHPIVLTMTITTVQKMSEEEQKLFRLYGKLPTHKNVLTKMQGVRHSPSSPIVIHTLIDS